VIEFDPEGDTIPRLFDEFDRIAAATAGREVKGELPADYERLFAYSLLAPSPDVAEAAGAFRPAFAHLALLAQIPGVDIAERMEAEKGASLSAFEAAILAERTVSARAWLDSYAPARARLVIRHDAVPEEVAALDAAQRAYLGALPRLPRPRRLGRATHGRPDLPCGRRNGNAVRARIRCLVRGFPGPNERPARRLAAGQPRTRLRGGAVAGRSRLIRPGPVRGRGHASRDPSWCLSRTDSDGLLPALPLPGLNSVAMRPGPPENTTGVIDA